MSEPIMVSILGKTAVPITDPYSAGYSPNSSGDISSRMDTKVLHFAMFTLFQM
ncbi:hypothetical protein ACFOU2_15665 [Bacillus songklensis]|uniref:Uncharacterized protein n=1 Tax=Bacillus songklensis TaxID=1069116 RepID=A0ABV8B3E0_9BACI